MRAYELMFILDVNLSEEDRRGVVEAVEDEIVDVGAEIVTSKKYGTRDLAYPIKGVTRGDYHLIQFRGDPQANQELEERLNFRDDILRYLLVRLDEEEPFESERSTSEEPEEPSTEEDSSPEEPTPEEAAEGASEDETAGAETG